MIGKNDPNIKSPSKEIFSNICYRLEGIKQVCIICILLHVLGSLWGLIDEKELVLTAKEAQATGRDEGEAGNQKQVEYVVEELRRKVVHVTITPYEGASLIIPD